MGRLNATEEELTYHVVDDRRAIRSAWGRGNPKIGTGPGIYTYSRLPGRRGTCPGATQECEAVCYSKRFYDNIPLWEWMRENTDRGADIPPLPTDATLVRFHVSGDFDTPEYVEAWIELCRRRPDVLFFGYTRSWRVPTLLPKLARLKLLLNVQLFASMDITMKKLPPPAWRRAWLGEVPRRWLSEDSEPSLIRAAGNAPVFVCPEEVGRKPNCEACGYCFKGQRGDVLFPIHGEPVHGV